MLEDTTYISQKKYNNLYTDYLGEILAIYLYKYENVKSDIYFKRVGSNQRPYLKDISNIDKFNYDLNSENIVIEVNREGIYDYLPEGLFHEPTLASKQSNPESIVAEIREIRNAEENSRKFFQPFELEILYLQMTSLLKESEYDLFDPSDTLSDLMAELWPLINEVDDKTSKILINILPFLHKIRGKSDWISRFLSAFTNIPVEISYVPNIINAKDDDLGLTLLGNIKLGLTFVPSGDHKDSDRNWLISYGPIPYKDIYKYVDGHPFRKLLNVMYDYLTPITVKVFENFKTTKSDSSFILDNEAETDRLGYSTFI